MKLNRKEREGAEIFSQVVSLYESLRLRVLCVKK